VTRSARFGWRPFGCPRGRQVPGYPRVIPWRRRRESRSDGKMVSSGDTRTPANAAQLEKRFAHGFNLLGSAPCSRDRRFRC
jgi:hypothetical protein